MLTPPPSGPILEVPPSHSPPFAGSPSSSEHLRSRAGSSASSDGPALPSVPPPLVSYWDSHPSFLSFIEANSSRFSSDPKRGVPRWPLSLIAEHDITPGIYYLHPDRLERWSNDDKRYFTLASFNMRDLMLLPQSTYVYFSLV